VTGDTTPPTLAYAEYYRVCLSGKTERLILYLSEKAKKEFESFDTTSRRMIVELCKTRPEKIRIGKPSVSGNEISFSATGISRQGEKAVGKIKMIEEQGEWKVLEDKWEFTSQ
jgi:hypothetical protein